MAKPPSTGPLPNSGVSPLCWGTPRATPWGPRVGLSPSSFPTPLGPTPASVPGLLCRGRSVESGAQGPPGPRAADKSVTGQEGSGAGGMTPPPGFAEGSGSDLGRLRGARNPAAGRGPTPSRADCSRLGIRWAVESGGELSGWLFETTNMESARGVACGDCPPWALPGESNSNPPDTPSAPPGGRFPGVGSPERVVLASKGLDSG